MDDRYYLQGMEIFSASQLILFISLFLSLSLSLRAEESVEVDSDDDYPYDEVSLDQWSELVKNNFNAYFPL